MYIRESIHINEKELALETGQIARQADGAVLATYGDTQVLVTVVTADARDDIGYFPLRVDYEERFYAAGKIPGGFFKREGRPSDVAILSGRMIDRPIRPLFPKGYKDEVQIVATVLSAEPDCSPSALAILGASTALMITNAPFGGPIAGVNVGRKDGRFVANPDAEAVETGGVHITVAGTKETVTMVEGMMDELSEDEVVEAIGVGHQAIRELIALQERFVDRIGQVEKTQVEAPVEDRELNDRVRELVGNEFSTMPTLESKRARDDFIKELKKHAVERLVPETTPVEEAVTRKKEVEESVESLLETYMREQVLERGVRLDGRRPDEVRSISCRVSVLPRTHGSALFTRGETQSLGIITLGAARTDEQIIDQMMFDGRKRFMLHYNFPPFSVGEVRRLMGPSRRSIGHGYLAENSLRAVMPSEEEFPYVVRVVSEILESNGSSSMATVCSASLAMMDAGVPIKKAVAGIAMGMIEDPVTKRRVILTDIQGAEDHHGDMDFKVVGTREGVTGFQLDVKVGGIDSATMREALQQAREARLTILGEMEKAIPAARTELSPYAPKLLTIKIPVEKIGLVIGPGGKMIRQIIEETGAQIDISDDGSVKIAAVDGDSAIAARQWIEDMTAELEVGTVFTTKVTRIVDFGAFVEMKGGGEGLVHVSNLASGFVDKVSDHVSVGDEITIEVIGEDKMGRPDLKRLEPGEAAGGRSAPRRERGDRSGGRRESSREQAPASNVKAGDIIEGTVSNTTEYGAFVEIAPDVTGLIHISALSDDYVRRVTDVVRSGDAVTVEVMNIDERGRYKLRRIVPEEEGQAQEPERQPDDPEADEQDVVEQTEERQPQAAEVESQSEDAEDDQEVEEPTPSPTPVEEEPAETEQDKQPTEFEDRW
ncbi:MAG: polyribonucleotide nucleotidyltransferase [Candidatus Bipolaricaulia bacterium]